MKKRIHLQLLIAALMLAGPGRGLEAASAPQDPRLRASFWTRNYSPMDDGSPQADRARWIFERVRKVADSGDQREPRLLLIDSDLEPLALALEDRTVVLSKSALDLAFQGASGEAGDAGLAFILGHELAHLERQDFRHFTAYFSASGGREGRAEAGLPRILLPDLADLQRSELLADREGLILMTVAGFDPALILEEGAQFFERWVTRAPAARAYASADHPTPGQRSAFLLSQLQPIVERLALFHLGTRSYQLGHFERAAGLLEEFRLTFAGPAVLNNLGLAYYQMGLGKLARCDGREVVRLRFPTLIDPKTVAERFRMRGPENPCIGQIGEFDQALRELRAVFRKAPDYHPGLLNLASILTLTGRSAEALADPIPRLLDRYPGPDSSQQELLALYSYDRRNRPQEDSRQIVERFAQLARQYPGSAVIAYNHAVVVREISGQEAAIPLFRRFLEREVAGPFAEHARELLDLPESPPAPPRTRPAPKPLLPLGKTTTETGAWLRSSFGPPLEFPIDGHVFRLFQDGQVRILQRIERGSASIEWVEQSPGHHSPEEVIRTHGEPLWRVASVSGEFLRYEDFAYDVSAAGSAVLIFFR